MKLVYTNHRPTFYILADSLQWILALKKITRKDGRIEYSDCSYHCGLGDLFSYLAEHQFRDSASEVKELKGMMETVYQVHESLAKSIGKLGDESSISI